MDSPDRIVIDFFGDYVCPFSYLTLPVLHAAQQHLGERIELHWRGFELRPQPMPPVDAAGAEFKRSWRLQVEPLAAERGITLQMPVLMPRTHLAMQAAAFAREAGAFDAMHKALFGAFFEHGRDISSINELVRIGGEVGLDRTELRVALDQDAYAAQVAADRDEAHIYGVAGVPVMALRRADQAKEQAQALWGAQPLEGVLKGVEVVRSGG